MKYYGVIKALYGNIFNDVENTSWSNAKLRRQTHMYICILNVVHMHMVWFQLVKV